MPCQVYESELQTSEPMNCSVSLNPFNCWPAGGGINNNDKRCSAAMSVPHGSRQESDLPRPSGLLLMSQKRAEKEPGHGRIAVLLRNRVRLHLEGQAVQLPAKDLRAEAFNRPKTAAGGARGAVKNTYSWPLPP